MKTTDKIRKQIDTILEERAEAIVAIQMKQEEATAALSAAEAEIQAAAEQMDEDRFAEATKAKTKAETTLAMCSRKLDQITRRELISEEESDRVLDELFDYEKGLVEDFKGNAGKILLELHRAYTAHMEQMDTAEALMQEWTRDVHANYRSRSTTYFDPETGEGTNRCSHAIPFEGYGPSGGQTAIRVRNALDTLKDIWRATNG